MTQWDFEEEREPFLELDDTAGAKHEGLLTAVTVPDFEALELELCSVQEMKGFHASMTANDPVRRRPSRI